MWGVYRKYFDGYEYFIHLEKGGFSTEEEADKYLEKNYCNSWSETYYVIKYEISPF